MARRPAKKNKSVKIDFSNVGKQFEADMEYAVEVKACALEDGNEFPYYAFQFKGVDEDYEDSILYHNASTSPQALWRLRPLFEALGVDIEDGEAEYDPDDFVGLKCMCSTVLDKNPSTGKSSVKPEEFWPLDEPEEKPKGKSGKKAAAKDDDDDKPAKKPARGKKKEEPELELDLDAIDDADIKRLGKEFQIASRKVDEIREQLAEADEDEVIDACKDLEIDLGGEPEEPEEKEDKKPSRSKAGSGKSSGKKKPAKLSQDEVNDMGEEELDDLVEQHDLDIDLSEFKTLRKKKAAVIDALTEAGAIED